MNMQLENSFCRLLSVFFGLVLAVWGAGSIPVPASRMWVRSHRT